MEMDAGTTYNDDEQNPLAAIMSPLSARGIDPDTARANPQMFAKLQGGGVGMPSAGDPAKTAAPAPPSAPATGGVPAAVSKSGNPDISADATKQAFQAMQGLPSPADELSQEKSLEDKRAADAAKLSQNLRDPQTGKLLDQYRPSVGQRIWRGARGALEGLAFGGIPGAIRGAVAPQIYPGDDSYGAPNAAGKQELRAEQGAVASDDASLAERSKRFKDAYEAATGTSKELTAIAATDRANRPQATKSERVVDAQGNVRYLSPDEVNAGQYKDPATYNADNKQDKTQPVINAKTGGLEFRTADEVNKAPGQYRQVSTQNLIIRDGDKAGKGGGKQIGVINTESGALEYHTPDEINSSGGKYQLASGRGGKGTVATPGQVAAAEVHKDRSLQKLESTYKWDSKENVYVNRRDENDTLSEDEWNGKKQSIQDDYEAERGALTGAPQGHFDYKTGQQAQAPGAQPAAPAAVSQSGAPAATKPSNTKTKSGSDLGPAPQGSRDGRTGKLPDGTPVVVKNGRLFSR